MELVDIYNNRHEKMGYEKERHSLEDGEYRLSSFIWIMNSNNQILLQKRASTCRHCPDMWGVTAGGVRMGESSCQAAIREVKEELGIDVADEELEFIGSQRRHHDFVEIWFCKKDIEISSLLLDPTEVGDANWSTIDQFEEMIKNGTGIDTSYAIFKMYYDKFYN